MATAAASPSAAAPYTSGQNASYSYMMSKRELSLMDAGGAFVKRAANLQCAGVNLLPPVGLVSQTVKAGE